MDVDVVTEIEIDRPRERVAEYAADPDNAVDERDQPIPAGALHRPEPAQPEQHAALIFLVDAEALQ